MLSIGNGQERGRAGRNKRGEPRRAMPTLRLADRILPRLGEFGAELWGVPLRKALTGIVIGSTFGWLATLLLILLYLLPAIATPVYVKINR